MEKVRPWCGQPSDRGRLKNRTEALRSWSTGRCITYAEFQAIFLPLKFQRSDTRHFPLGWMPLVTRAENLVEFGHLAFEICSRTDIHRPFKTSTRPISLSQHDLNIPTQIPSANRLMLLLVMAMTILFHVN